MTPERAAILIPLLKIQPYIVDARYNDVGYGQDGERVTHDLNQFRATMREYPRTTNLAWLHLKTFGLPATEMDRPWLRVDQPLKIPGKPVLVSRSLRYPGTLNWKKVVKAYQDQIAFIGLEDEYLDFCQRFGNVYFYPTRDFLEVARVAAGCALYITNQNGCHAVAEGLKTCIIQESSIDTPTAVFPRPNAWYELPSKLPRIAAEVIREPLNLIFSGPLDGFSSVAADTMVFISGLIKLGHKVWNRPTRYSECYGLEIPKVTGCETGPAPKNAAHIVFDTVEEFRNLSLVMPGDIVITLWEASIWPDYCLLNLSRARAVLTTCQWNADTLKACGCAIPIYLVPLYTKPSIFTPAAQKPKICTFGAAGRICLGGERKGLNDVVKAFRLAFPFHSDVRLRLKLFPDCSVDGLESDKRIETTRQCLEFTELAQWYQGNTAFVSASRAEGWGKCLCDAMSCSSAPIACKFGGQADFFDASVGYEIPYTMADCDTSVYKTYGLWAVPSLPALVQIMRRVYLMRQEADDFGCLAAERAAQFNPERTVAALERALRLTLG
jgi:glycosyltransferase involved in cell wall biosynthesis